MIGLITRNDILLSVREKLKDQKINGLSGSITSGNSATNMIRPPYVMSDAAKKLKTTVRWDDPYYPAEDFAKAYSGNQ